jgi:hypothetical protein
VNIPAFCLQAYLKWVLLQNREQHGLQRSSRTFTSTFSAFDRTGFFSYKLSTAISQPNSFGLFRSSRDWCELAPGLLEMPSFAKLSCADLAYLFAESASL